MTKEDYVKSIKEKIKKIVSENNYKLALAITGHRPGKIRDVVLASKEGEALLDYIEQQDQIIRKVKELIESKDFEESFEGLSNYLWVKDKFLEILDRNVK